MSGAGIRKGAATPPFCCAIGRFRSLGGTALLVAGLIGSEVASADAEAGRAKAQACATCHGAAGISAAPNTPHLAGQPEGYLVDQLKAFRSGRRPSEVMNVVAKPLSDADIADLAAWYGSQEIVLKGKSAS